RHTRFSRDWSSDVCSSDLKKNVDRYSSCLYAIGMSAEEDFEIFLVSAPGLESVLCEEARAKGFAEATPVTGGVTIRGGWPEVWRSEERRVGKESRDRGSQA